MGGYGRLNYNDCIYLKDVYNYQGQLIFFEVYSDIGY